ncbi:MAG: sulfatase-like hydrolase/transferase, partial [Gemmatimonadetes bacterium]|nr:sulfatase-like hydrolase/transferase [Gemmatimonadota bacterium]
AAMIESMDQGIGQVLDRLTALGLDENTVVVFTSDNGGHGNSTSNEPLRGSKGMLYEGGVRVPLAVRWSGVARPGSRNDTPNITMDLFPTLLELAGAPLPLSLTIDGVSLVPLLRGAPSLTRQALFWHFPVYLEAYAGQTGPWRATPSSAMRQGDWKLIESFEDGRLELYNLREHPSEKRDLAATHPAKARELREALARWRASVGAPVPTTRNPAYEQRSGAGREPLPASGRSPRGRAGSAGAPRPAAARGTNDPPVSSHDH